MWFNPTVAAHKVFWTQLFSNFSNLLFLNKNLNSENLSAKNRLRIFEKSKKHRFRFMKAKHANFKFFSEQTWLLFISISPKLKIFATRKKANFCSSLEHKFYARTPQKASAFLRGKTLLKNASITPESKMRITRFFTFILFFIDEKSVEFLKTHKIKIATLFLRFANI